VAKKTKTKPKPKREGNVNDPWISMRSGLKVIAFASIVVFIMTVWQGAQTVGWLKGILWGLVFGGSIWLIFFGALKLNQWIRRK